MVNPELYVDKAVATLKANVNTFIDTVNADFADSITVPHVDPSALLAGGANQITRYPAIEVAAPDWDLTQVSLGQQTADLSLRVMAMCWTQHPVTDVLYRLSCRFAWAVLACLMQPDAFSPIGDRVVVEGASGRYRFNPETNERDEFTAGTLLLMQIGFGAER